MTAHRAGRGGPSRAAGLRLPPFLARPAVRLLGRRVLDPGLPWEVQRRRLDRFMRALPVPRGTSVTHMVLNGVPAEVVTVNGVHPQCTVVHFHGGGYCVGSARMARAWAAHLSAQALCRVVLPEYRLAPAHAHPAAVDDGRTVLDALLSGASPAISGASPAIVVSGDSAGAGLALSAVVARREENQELPAGCILMSPWLDLGRDRRAMPDLVRRDVLLSPEWLEACAVAYAPPSSWAAPSVSPLFAAHGGLPPLLIQAGSDELVASDAEGLAASAAAAGVDVTYTRWPCMWHNFALQPGLVAAADSALAQAAWFVRTVAGS
jgi:epsilon-lactone hydrolase